MSFFHHDTESALLGTIMNQHTWSLAPFIFNYSVGFPNLILLMKFLILEVETDSCAASVQVQCPEVPFPKRNQTV